MNERHFLDLISGRRRGVVAAMLRGALALGIPAYGAAVRARNCLFDVGLHRIHSAGIPVVSVGNITTGGTGKTPVVAWVAEWFRSQGKRPCLVSRGYRSLVTGENDERRVLAQLCPDVPHVQDRDRVAVAREAVRVHTPGVLILDDGFQHRRLARDLDIVLIDATNPWGYGHLLPRGLLREPRSALRRADVLVLTRVDQVNSLALSQVRSEVSRWTEAPMFEVRFVPTGIRSLSGKTATLEELAGRPVAAFCGIGNPEGFRRTLDLAGIAVEDESFSSFADHHHYSVQDIRQLIDRAKSQGVAALVTTQKDLVKLDPAWETAVPVWAVTIGVEVMTGRKEWERLLSCCIPETGTVRAR